MSTFSGLNTAYTGLVAARTGLDVTGQNIANSTTEGYTRQRVETSPVAPMRPTMFSTGSRVGEGVLTQGIARMGEAQLDARVRITAASAGYTAVRAEAYSALEGSLREPGELGVSSSLRNFWAGWQELGNDAQVGGGASKLLADAGELTARVSSGIREVETQWAAQRSAAVGVVSRVNDTAGQIAVLNGQIRTATTSGTSPNELIDRRNLLTANLAGLTGATVRDNADGTTDVLVAGNPLVAGSTARSLQVAGPTELGADGKVQVEWTHRPGVSAALESGELAATLSVLAPAEDGGPLAQAAAGYNSFAANLADQVNAVHSAAGKGPFFSYEPGRAAASLTVVPTGKEGLAIGAVGAGGFDGSVAHAISLLGKGSGSPDAAWSSFVTGLGAAAGAELRGNAVAEVSANAAVQQQMAATSVSMDEEQVNLLKYQHAYQGAARVMTAVDQMLDVLINRMGIVGR